MTDKNFIIIVCAICTVIIMAMGLLIKYQENQLQFYKEVINQAAETNTAVTIRGKE